jgi:UDP-N-acetylglucosamine:LPS N-acetylglucosamine transferase
MARGESAERKADVAVAPTAAVTDVAVAPPAAVTDGAAAAAASVAVRSELFSKPLSDDNALGQFGNYLCKVGQHICLDARDCIEKLRGKGFDGEDVLETGADAAGPDEGCVAAPRRKKILILMSDTGGGHRASANAIKAALLSLESEEELEVKIVDVLEDYTLWFSNRLYTWYVTYPPVWEYIYKTTKSTAGKPWPMDTSKFLEPTVQGGFRRCIAAEEPDLVLSVHPILQCIPLANFMPKRPPRPIPFLTCVTDLGDGHPWWFNQAADRLFVPSEGIKAQALERGVLPERIVVSGLPLRPGFWDVNASAGNKARVRELLGLGGGGRKVVLLMGGGDGMGKLEKMVKVLSNELAQVEYTSQMVIVCGRNTALETRLSSAPWPKGCELDAHTHARCSPNPDADPGTGRDEGGGGGGGGIDSGARVLVRVLGFVSNVEEYMLASHLIVSKAGPVFRVRF